MSENTQTSQVVLRYVRKIDAPDDCTYDIYYIDRTTGKEVMRYDGADPANTKASYGAITDEEAFQNKSLNINEEVDIKFCVTPVSQFDVTLLIQQKELKEQEEKEIGKSQDLFDFLDREEIDHFDFEDWYAGEKSIFRPALEKRGYTNISFSMGEEDSFGPLIRLIRCQDTDGKWVRFYYG